jgi:MFS family permease
MVDAKFPIYRAAFSGLLALLVGIGVARFGYAPLVPELVIAHWFSASAAFWLGTINLAGYFIGAAVMRMWRRPLDARRAVIGLMGLTAVAMLASAYNFGLLWFGMWRLLTGISGGVLMVLMAAAVVGRAPAAQRGRVSGITFAGMGTGITLSALLIPYLIRGGIAFTWTSLGVICVAATLIVAVIMPAATIIPAPKTATRGRISTPVQLLIIAYAGTAVGFMPHALFWASFVAIGLHRGVAAGAEVSAILGLAAAIGPPILGRVADRFGFLPTLAWGYVVMAAAVGLPLWLHATPALALSAAGVGAVALGSVMLAAGAIATLVPAERLAADWGLATMIYAVAQAAIGAGFSALFHVTGSFDLLFGIGAIALLACALLVFAVARLASS